MAHCCVGEPPLPQLRPVPDGDSHGSPADGHGSDIHIETDVDALAERRQQQQQQQLGSAGMASVARLPFAFSWGGGGSRSTAEAGAAQTALLATARGRSEDHDQATGSCSSSSTTSAAVPPPQQWGDLPRVKVGLHVLPSDAGEFVVLELSVAEGADGPGCSSNAGMAQWVYGTAASYAWAYTGVLPQIQRLAGVGFWGGQGACGSVADALPASSSHASGLVLPGAGKTSSTGGDSSAAMQDEGTGAAAAADVCVELVMSVSASSERPLTVVLHVHPPNSDGGGRSGGGGSGGGGHAAVGSWIYGAATSAVSYGMSYGMRRSSSSAAAQPASAVGASSQPSSQSCAEPSCMQPGASGTEGGGASNAAAANGDDEEDLDLLMLEDMRMVLAGSGLDGHDADAGSRADGSETGGLVGGGGWHAAGVGTSAASYASSGSTAGTSGGTASGTAVYSSALGSAAAIQPPLSCQPGDDAASGAGGVTVRPYSVAVRLLFDLHPACPEQQQWQAQAGRCSGCKAELARPDASACTSRSGRAVAGAAMSWWGGRGGGGSAAGGRGGGAASTIPRLCWYTGRLFCRDCHQGQTAVIPAHVLRRWDFTPRPVSCAAQEYLAAICEQPLLCVTAINPGLYDKVALLKAAREIRGRLRANLAAASSHGPAAAADAGALLAGSGGRAYLLGAMEDFWSLADLVELSKGPLSSLAHWLDQVDAQLAALIANATAGH